MRYDLTIPLRDLSGVQLTDEVDAAGFTLKSTLVRSALYLDKAKPATPDEKHRAYRLAKRIATAGDEIEFSIDDVAFLKAQVGAMWTPLVMGQVWELLEAPLPPKPVADIPGDAPAV